MRQMNQMFSSPFGFPSGGMLGIAAAPAQARQPHHSQQRQNQLAPVDLFSFGGFGGMFQNMRRMMDDMHSTFVSIVLVSS